MIKRLKTIVSCLLSAVVLSLCAVSSASEPALILPSALKSVAEEAFRGNTSIYSVVLQEGVSSIGANAFTDSSLRELTLPASVTSIAGNAFEGSGLKFVNAEKDSYAYQWLRDNGYIAEYRALLIGEQSFLWFIDEGDPDSGCWLDDEDQRNISDVSRLASSLSNAEGPHGVYGPDGGAITIVQKTNLSYDGIRSAIQTTFADTRDQDISVFFIATHGNDSGDGELRTAFTGSFTDANIAKYWKYRELSFSTLAGWLKTYVKGRILIILESCGSGSAIYKGGTASKGRTATGGDTAANAERFVNSAVQTFSKADPGIRVHSDPLKANSTGDLRQPKFYVLAASKHHEKSYGWETGELDDSYNFFTEWLIEGIGNKSNSPADSNSDSCLSVTELFNYIRQYDSYPIGSVPYYQHVRCYPSDSTVKLLRLVR